jgi:hypothetical protein
MHWVWLSLTILLGWLTLGALVAPWLGEWLERQDTEQLREGGD